MRHLAANSWKALDEFIERVIIFQILKERFHRHSRAHKNRSAAENFGVNGDQRVCGHASSITDSCVRVNDSIRDLALWKTGKPRRRNWMRSPPTLFVASSFDFRLVTTVVSEPQMDYRKIVNAAAALEKQIGRYRQMTGEQRLSIALELHELSCDVAREGICRANPGADTAEVERLLHRRLELARAR
jgi:hypothetical protein